MNGQFKDGRLHIPVPSGKDSMKDGLYIVNADGTGRLTVAEKVGRYWKWLGTNDSRDTTFVFDEPTHWRPLPAPPVGTIGGG